MLGNAHITDLQCGTRLPVHKTWAGDSTAEYSWFCDAADWHWEWRGALHAQLYAKHTTANARHMPCNASLIYSVIMPCNQPGCVAAKLGGVDVNDLPTCCSNGQQQM